MPKFDGVITQVAFVRFVEATMQLVRDLLPLQKAQAVLEERERIREVLYDALPHDVNLDGDHVDEDCDGCYIISCINPEEEK